MYKSKNQQGMMRKYTKNALVYATHWTAILPYVFDGADLTRWQFWRHVQSCELRGRKTRNPRSSKFWLLFCFPPYFSASNMSLLNLQTGHYLTLWISSPDTYSERRLGSDLIISDLKVSSRPPRQNNNALTDFVSFRQRIVQARTCHWNSFQSSDY